MRSLGVGSAIDKRVVLEPTRRSLDDLGIDQLGVKRHMLPEMGEFVDQGAVGLITGKT